MAKIDFKLPVKLAAEMVPCPDGCDEPYCLLHSEHYADCPCPGPHSDPEEEEPDDGG